jgi:hypothetical protein
LLHNPAHNARPTDRGRAAEQLNKTFARRSRAFRDYFDPPVVEIRRPPGQTQFKGPRSHPPPKPDALHAPANPDGDPGRVAAIDVVHSRNST